MAKKNRRCFIVFPSFPEIMQINPSARIEWSDAVHSAQSRISHIIFIFAVFYYAELKFI